MSVTQFSTLSIGDGAGTISYLGHSLKVYFNHLSLSHKIKEQIVAKKKRKNIYVFWLLGL